MSKNSKDLNALVGAVLKGEYKKRGKRLEDIAPTVGIPYGTLRKKIAGQSPIFAKELVLIAAAIGVEADRVLREAVEMYGGLSTLVADNDLSAVAASNVSSFPIPGSADEYDHYQSDKAAHPITSESTESDFD